MTLRDELACILPDDDRPALPRYVGVPLDEVLAPTRRIARTPNRRELAILECVPAVRWWTTPQVARASGVTDNWVRTLLGNLMAMGLVEERKGAGRGHGAGRKPSEWRKTRGAGTKEGQR